MFSTTCEPNRVIILLSVNFNGFRTTFDHKIDQMLSKGNERIIDSVLFSFSDTHWYTWNKEIMIKKLKGFNKNTIISMSHSDDALNESKTVLKAIACAALWNEVVNYVDTSNMNQHKLWWWNSAVLTGNKKIF